MGAPGTALNKQLSISRLIVSITQGQSQGVGHTGIFISIIGEKAAELAKH